LERIKVLCFVLCFVLFFVLFCYATFSLKSVWIWKTSDSISVNPHLKQTFNRFFFQPINMDNNKHSPKNNVAILQNLTKKIIFCKTSKKFIKAKHKRCSWLQLIHYLDEKGRHKLGKKEKSFSFEKIEIRDHEQTLSAANKIS